MKNYHFILLLMGFNAVFVQASDEKSTDILEKPIIDLIDGKSFAITSDGFMRFTPGGLRSVPIRRVERVLADETSVKKELQKNVEPNRDN